MTFQAITYPLDLYAGRLKRQSSFRDYSLFMAFFPRLLSGPIVRASFFMPQLDSNQGFDGKRSMEGLALMIRGLIKKVIIADILATQIVDPAFNSPEIYSSIFLVIALIAFSYQVYMDLGGYTDIALGIGKILGYDLPINFNRPYMATSVANYWQRWHISMSSFFRDYLYDSIVSWKWCNLYCKLLIVFIAVGLWHGAGWNFILYGIIHGSVVGYEHYRKKRRSMTDKPPIIYRGKHYVLRIIQIFSFVTITRILFRCDSLAESIRYFQSIFTSSVAETPVSIMAGGVLLLAIILHYTPISWRDQLMSRFIKLPVAVSAGITTIIIYMLTALGSDKTAFLYFDF
jgi:alginate O-acetyltransferase complex protein AlgI